MYGAIADTKEDFPHKPNAASNDTFCKDDPFDSPKCRCFLQAF